MPPPSPRIWSVGALTRAIADSLDARFNPVGVRGEISGFSRAASGHCYFSLKDANGQLRCAMFRRAAMLLEFLPRDGDQVEVEGRLGVYEGRGDLQLVVETLRAAGQGALFEQFMRLKARLEAQGLFAAERKRALPVFPRTIGIVTSPNAAALHDVLTCLRRRAPHVPVIIAPAAVQGTHAPGEIVDALDALYRSAAEHRIDTILLVRGGGSIEDLWAFNDERVAHKVVASPVPLVCGVGHETDFTIADFCADVRAPTPTAAAEMVSHPRREWLEIVAAAERRLQDVTWRRIDAAAQRVDQTAARLGRPLARLGGQQMRLQQHAHRLDAGVRTRLERAGTVLVSQEQSLASAVRHRLRDSHHLLDRLELRLAALDPRLVLQRGYAMLSREDGQPVTAAAQAQPGESLRAALADGEIDLRVSAVRVNPS